MMTRAAALLLSCVLSLSAFANFREFERVTRDPSLQARLQEASAAVLTRYPKLKPEDLAISLVDLTKSSTPARADIRGDERFYPASVIKLFFLADLFTTGKETLPDVDRAMKEMIVASDNDATAYIVDILSEAPAGVSLEGRALRRFVERRRAINRRFEKLGYEANVSAMMKPWSFGPYGRERQLLGEARENRNMLTANATAALMLAIARDRQKGAAPMLALLERPLAPARADENQVKEFIGEALPAGSKLWSKAGWTSEVRHDAALVELPGGRKLVLVIFTRGTADDVTLVPAVTRAVLDALQ